jgi:opacity protein-like surface antigen
MSSKFVTIAAAVAAALGAASASADVGDMFSVRGYGTLGGVYSDLDGADYNSLPFMHPEGVGHSDSFSAEIDSKTGLQVDMRFTERLTGVIQLVSEAPYNNSWDGDPNDDFFPSLEWANLSYKLTDDVTVRAGRIVLPLLMSAEYRKVGYASHWLRAPVEVYGKMAFNSSDGADIAWRSQAGAGFNTVHAHVGTTSLRTDTFKAQVDQWGLNDTFEVGSVKLRAAYMNLKYESVEGFQDVLGFAQILESLPFGIGADAGREARRLYEKYDPASGQKMHFFALGAAYDPGSWFVMGEALHIKSDLLNASTGGYVSGGVRTGKFTPYVTLSLTESDQKSEAGIPTAGLPAPLAFGAAAVNESMLEVINDDNSQRSIALGMRWDVANNFALKAQYDYVDLASGSTGVLTNYQPGFERGTDFNVFSLAVDFVF